MPSYRAPGWLPGAHLQTIFPLTRKAGFPPTGASAGTPGQGFHRSRLVAASSGGSAGGAFHGLEGSSQSHYARALMRELERAGWNGVVPHFRGCSGEPNLLARAYHSGDSDEIDWILRRIAARHPDVPRFAAGVSLGGNALLKWLGEQGDGAASVIHAAAAICPPLDLNVSGHALGAGFNRVYTRNFLNTLKAKALAKLASVGGPCAPQAVQDASTLYEFDTVYTGPLHGFRDADDYWSRASSKPWLRHHGSDPADKCPQRSLRATTRAAKRIRAVCGNPVRNAPRWRACGIPERRMAGPPAMAASASAGAFSRHLGVDRDVPTRTGRRRRDNLMLLCNNGY